MRLFVVLLAFSSLIILSCESKKSSQQEEPTSEIRGLVAGDPNVQKAFEKAQEELPHFISEFSRYSNDFEYMFYVKTRFQQDDKVEHMWSFIIEQKDNEI